MGSSLIYVAIVAMWAGLLVPMWLRRHEQETEVRSVDRFSAAMRILSRRTPPPPDRRYLVMPHRPPSATLPVADVPRAGAPHRPASRPVSRPVEQRVEARPAPRRPARPQTGRSRLIARRRRIFLGLVAVAVLMLVLAAFGVVSYWWQLVADVAVGAFVFHLRAEAKRARALERRRRTSTGRVAAPPAPRGPVETVDVPATGRSAALTPPAAREAAEGAMVVDEGTWEPVPVPLPTYVTAPVAEAQYVDAQYAEEQTIDLTRPGAWSEAHSRAPVFDQDAAELLEDTVDDDFAQDFADDDLDVIVERRRAVND